MLPAFQVGSRGRVVKATDSKSVSLWEHRFESCRLRDKIFFLHWTHQAKLLLQVRLELTTPA